MENMTFIFQRQLFLNYFIPNKLI